MRGAPDEAARAHGLTGARDWMVLSPLLATYSPQEQDLLRGLLARLAPAAPAEDLRATGSCI